VPLALGGTWWVTCSYAWWFQAVRPEVYALQALLVMIAIERIVALEADWPTHDVRPLYVAFLRILAVFCLVNALVYWAQLIGISGRNDLRFDELDANARMSYTALAVVLPFAGLGLWFTSSWGIAVWLASALTQIAMHSYWTALYGERPLLLASIALAAMVLAAFNLWLVFVWRSERLKRY